MSQNRTIIFNKSQFHEGNFGLTLMAIFRKLDHCRTLDNYA
jgi:hypothetical protein